MVDISKLSNPTTGSTSSVPRRRQLTLPPTECVPPSAMSTSSVLRMCCACKLILQTRDAFRYFLHSAGKRERQGSTVTMSINCLYHALNITSFHILIVFHCILMYDDNRYIIITIVHLHLQTHNMSLQFNGNDAVVIYLKSKWIEINLLCDVTLLTADFP